ncbi:MAG: metal ABC transporter substrate-binding protein [Actinobacteria bacterium]|nr:metal ABC transporter substrate-binding protein [Actinomycetota bacterium]
MRRGAFYLILMISITLMSTFAGCITQSAKPGEMGKIKIVTTISPLADMISKVGGEKVEVISILPPGASPHVFEPSIEQLKNAANSAALMKIGLSFDDWADKIASASYSNMKIFVLSDNVTLNKDKNPHIWLSLKRAIIIVENIHSYLSELDPASKQYYEGNAAEYIEKIKAKDREFSEGFNKKHNKKFVQFHDAWNYFAEDYGLQIVATIEPFPGKEPTPQYLADVEKIIRDNNIKVVFSEPQLNDRIVNFLAEELKINVEILDPEGANKELKEYLSLMQYNYEKILNSFN